MVFAVLTRMYTNTFSVRSGIETDQILYRPLLESFPFMSNTYVKHKRYYFSKLKWTSGKLTAA